MGQSIPRLFEQENQFSFAKNFNRTTTTIPSQTYHRIKMVAIYLFFILAIQQGYAQNRDPGPCAELPGLVYNAELEECAWPDEVGCSLGDLGISADCNGLEAGDFTSVDGDIPNPPENRESGQYFIVCVPESTDEDIQKRKEQRARAYIYPSGPVVPRLLGCPDPLFFDAETKSCIE